MGAVRRCPAAPAALALESVLLQKNARFWQLLQRYVVQLWIESRQNRNSSLHMVASIFFFVALFLKTVISHFLHIQNWRYNSSGVISSFTYKSHKLFWNELFFVCNRFRITTKFPTTAISCNFSKLFLSSPFAMTSSSFCTFRTCVYER